jgi:hypothetical protein
MDTNSIFNVVTKGSVVTVSLADRKEFDSLRTGLLRRYTRWATDFSNMGDDSYAEQYVSSVFVPTTGVATFQLKPKDEMRRKPKSYVVTIL